MTRMRARAIGSILLAAAVAVAIPAAYGSPPETNPQLLTGVGMQPSVGLANSGLFDGSRLDLRHSLSFGYSSSTVFGNRSAGLWMTNVGYRLADPLRISVDLGAVLDPSADSILNENSFFLGGFNVDYQPSENFRLNISYVNVPSRARPALGYAASPFGYLRSGPPGTGP